MKRPGSKAEKKKKKKKKVHQMSRTFWDTEKVLYWSLHKQNDSGVRFINNALMKGDFKIHKKLDVHMSE